MKDQTSVHLNIIHRRQIGKSETGNAEEQGVLGVSEVCWKGQGEIRSGDYKVYSGGERAEKGVAIVVHESIMRIIVKKIVFNDRIIAIKLQQSR